MLGILSVAFPMLMLVSDCGRLGKSLKEMPCLLGSGVAGEGHQPHPRIFKARELADLDQNKIISASVLNKVW